MAQRRRRRRRRLNPRFLVLVGLMALLLVLMIWGIASCTGSSDPQDTTGSTGSLQDTSPKYGWMEENGKRYYLNSDGSRATGWLEVDGKRYLLTDDGYTQSGWIDGLYFRPDGSMAQGAVEIDGKTVYFTSQGKEILLVNPWNPVPEGYEPDLVELSLDISVEGSKVDRSCYDALVAMIAACNKECPRLCVLSSYRTNEYQANAFERKVQSYTSKGYSREDAEREAATVVARPGTSEHQLGLAVDIIDTREWSLEETQKNLPAQKWLMEHSWEYGFILRYPEGKIDKTGIIFEPWHYRYVGPEVAKEIHESGLTLEEYLEALTS